MIFVRPSRIPSARPPPRIAGRESPRRFRPGLSLPIGLPVDAGGFGTGSVPLQACTSNLAPRGSPSKRFTVRRPRPRLPFLMHVFRSRDENADQPQALPRGRSQPCSRAHQSGSRQLSSGGWARSQFFRHSDTTFSSVSGSCAGRRWASSNSPRQRPPASARPPFRAAGGGSRRAYQAILSGPLRTWGYRRGRVHSRRPASTRPNQLPNASTSSCRSHALGSS